MMDTKSIEKKLLDAGYEPRRRELLAVAGVMNQRGSGARCLLVEGPPGSGKTALGEALASFLGGGLIYYQCHSWSDADELFVGVNVVAAVAGDSEAVRQPGVLAHVAKLSQSGMTVVVILDEIDKAPERAEALLLDWLQSGRVPIRPGEHLQTRLDRVIIVITSNGTRPLGDPLLRRCRRVRMEPLPVEILDRLAAEKTAAAKGVVTLASRAARAVAESEGTVLSLQELCHLLNELELSESAGDVREALAGWAAKTPRGAAVAMGERLAAAIWGEIVRERRGI